MDTAWWQQFQDPLLDRLISDALAGNKNIRIAAANIEQAAAIITQIRSPLFPQISYGGKCLPNAGQRIKCGADRRQYPQPAERHADLCRCQLGN